jgi:hypothetical protein
MEPNWGCSAKGKKGKLYAHEITMLYPPYSTSEQTWQVSLTWYERYGIADHLISVLFNFLQSVTTTWRTRELVR